MAPLTVALPYLLLLACCRSCSPAPCSLHACWCSAVVAPLTHVFLQRERRIHDVGGGEGWLGMNLVCRTICIEGLLEDFYFQPREAFLSRNGVDGCGDRQDQTPDTRHVGGREGKGKGREQEEGGGGGDCGIIGSAKRRLSGKETRPAF